MNTQISISKKNAMVFGNTTNTNKSKMFNFNLEASKLGYLFDSKLLETINPNDYNSILSTLSKMKGADRNWKPFYPNFPEQVFEATDLELWFNAIRHYMSNGTWVLEGEVAKIPNLEPVKYTVIKGITFDKFLGIYTEMLGSNASLTEQDKSYLEFFVKNYSDKVLTPNIPFKETFAFFASLCDKYNKFELLTQSCKTSTDVLRLAVALSNGDSTLATNSKIKLNSKQKSFITKSLNNVIKEEDVARHEGMWKRLFFAISKYAKKYPKVWSVAQKNYKGELKTFNGKIAKIKDVNALVKTLMTKPGEFARVLDKLFVDYKGSETFIVNSFLSVANKVDTRVLYQVYAHFLNRNSLQYRVVTPKSGNTWILDKKATIDETAIFNLISGIRIVLQNRFNSLNYNLGKVYIDEQLLKCPIPMAMRTSSNGLKQLARGTKIPFNTMNKSVLRFFVHWYGNDIDLSATILAEDLSVVENIAYYNLRSGDWGAHSGDITYAPRPNGAAEFIDLNLKKLTSKSKYPNARYIALNVNVYSGTHEETVVGWMMRDNVSSNYNTFDAKTVEQKVEFSAKKGNAVIALFDIVTEEVIWVDTLGYMQHSGNNTLNAKADTMRIVKSYINSVKPNLYDLFYDHAQGNLVTNKEDADTIFDIDMVYNYTEILSKYLV